VRMYRKKIRQGCRNRNEQKLRGNPATQEKKIPVSVLLAGGKKGLENCNQESRSTQSWVQFNEKPAMEFSKRVRHPRNFICRARKTWKGGAGKRTKTKPTRKKNL